MSDSRTTRRKVCRRAATALEFAIIAPVLFGFVLGVAELGRGFMVAHLLNNAARVGCRTGAVEGRSTSDISTAVTNALTAEGLDSTKATVKVNDGSADASTIASGGELTVSVSMKVSDITWVPGGQYFTSGSLSGQYTLRRE
jgi:Flp pilus assembly protein TadG